MTAVQKKELEARDEFQREMDAYGLTVSGSISGHYVGDDFAATFRTEATLKKGCKGMIDTIRSHGYKVEEYARTDKSGKRYFVFVVGKTVMIPPSERVEDTAEAAATPVQRLEHITTEYGMPVNHLMLTREEYAELDKFLMGLGVRSRIMSEYQGIVTIQAENPYKEWMAREDRTFADEAMSEKSVAAYKR